MDDQNLKRMELLTKAQSGDAEAASTLYTLCYGDLYFYASQVIGNSAQAEAVTTETLVKMCSQKSAPNNAAQFTPWMMYFCHLVCRKYIPASTTPADLGGMLENESVFAVTDGSGILSEQIRSQMTVAIKTMPVEERAVMTLVYYESLPIEQVAMICGWKPQVAEAYRSSAIRTLKAIVQQNSKAVTTMPQNISMKPTIICVMAAIQKENKFAGVLTSYQDFCTSLHIAPSAAVLDQFTEKKPAAVAAPVVFNEAVYKKESFADRVKYWPKAVKVCIIVFLLAGVATGAVFGLKAFKPELFEPNGGVETSEPQSVIEDPLQNAASVTKKTKATYATDENGNEIHPTIKVAKKTTKYAVGAKRSTQTSKRNANGGRVITAVQKTTTKGVTRPKDTTATRNQAKETNPTNRVIVQTRAPQETQRKKVTTATNQTAYRPAAATTAAGSVKSQGKEKGFSYSILSNGTAHITGYDGSGAVSIPSTLGGKSVSAIGENAFKGKTNITSVSIPSSVSVISANAFKGCSGLTSVSMGNGVLIIETYAFANCTALKTVTWSSHLTNIRSGAFSGCSSLQSGTLPNSITSIENSAFKNCRSLVNVKTPSRLRNIENNTFYGCNSLKSVELYNSLVYIGGGAFYGCSALTTIYFHGTAQDWLNIPNESEATNKVLDKATIVYR
ncbi:MAG: leucine-rich repeat protein [Clostridia bacterium]|nr:leucine-rich repeat protein [Clostridia bacterium]